MSFARFGKESNHGEGGEEGSLEGESAASGNVHRSIVMRSYYREEIAPDRTRDESGGPDADEDRFPILGHVSGVTHESPRQGGEEHRRVRT